MAEVEQLLKDYAAYHYPSSVQGTMNIEAQRPGPGSWPLAKKQYLERSPLLRLTYDHLDRALRRLHDEEVSAWLAIHDIYLDPDFSPSRIAHLHVRAREGQDAQHTLVNIGYGIRCIASYLAATDLHVIWPARMTSREEKQVERRNDELYAVYLRHRDEGKSRGRAIADAATECGYGTSRTYEIVNLRESFKRTG